MAKLFTPSSNDLMAMIASAERKFDQARAAEQYVFLIGSQEEFLCHAPNRLAAQLKADAFVDREGLCLEPYGWVPSSQGQNVFRISVGA
jgi:hypothetical protein